jgi:UDP-glucose:(heptosyl)LPS alpha-1,3-glucosyltransferase
MKLALIIEHFDASRGGAEHLTVWLAGQLLAQGIEVHIVCHDVAHRVSRMGAATQRAGYDADRSPQDSGIPDFPPNLRIHRLRGMRMSTGLGFRRFGQRAAKWCKDNKPDIAHSMTVAFPGDIYHPHAGVYARIHAQAVASRPTSAAKRWKQFLLGTSFKQQTLLALERRAVRPASAGGPRRIIAICQMMADHLQSDYAVPPAQIFTLENPRMADPPDTAQSAEDRAWFRGHYKLAPTDKIALFVGHDFRRKGLHWAIQTIRQTSDWKLLVVGLGKTRPYLEQANLAGLADRVRFVGPTRQMSQIYSAGDALLLPTFYDSFGLVAIEALSFGLPVLSTAHLGAASLVKSHDAGIIVPTPRDIAPLAHYLESLPMTGPAHDDLATRARLASTGMTAKMYVQKLLALYQELQTTKSP